MKKLQILAPCIVIALGILFGGCVSTSLNARKSPGTDLSAFKTFYVEKLPADKHDVHQIIADELNKMGCKAIAGTETTPPEPVDIIVTYQDKWTWDLTMYMIEINIQFRDPQTRLSVASGKSFRSSLARKSPSELTAEVLNEIFKQK